MSVGNTDFVPVVLGTGLNAYSIARSLNEAYGVRTLVLGRAPSRETSHSAIIEVRIDRELNRPDRLLTRLLALADEFAPRRLIVFATIEYYTNTLLSHAATLEGQIAMALPSPEVAAELTEKSSFAATCERLGIPHPKTIVVAKGDCADDGFGSDLAFPIVLKPADTETYPQLRFEGKKKIYVIDDARALKATAAMIYDAGYLGDLIVQRYLAGDERVCQVVNTYSDSSGSLTAVAVAQSVLADWNQAQIGNYRSLVTTTDDQLVSLLARLLNTLGYTGLANFDVMLDSDGCPQILEANLRTGGAWHYSTAAGVNLAWIAVEDLVYGRPAVKPPEVLQCVEGVLWTTIPWRLAWLLAPRALRARIRLASRRRIARPLSYEADRSAARRLQVARVNLRAGLAACRFRRPRQ
jgi:D-aspartate ligase